MKTLILGLNFIPRKGEGALALGPYYLKSYHDYACNKAGGEVLIRQFSVTDPDEQIVSEIVSLEPDIVGFGLYVWNTQKAKILARSLKERMDSVKIVWGGPEASALAEQMLLGNPCVDVIVRGEGEITFSELLSGGLRQESLSGIQGITYRQAGAVINNPARPLINNLGSIPSPFLNNAFEFSNEYNVVHFESSRGCIYSCGFCSWTSKGLRDYPLERVFKELDIILRDNTVKGVCFCDSNILFNKKRAKEILSFLRGNNHQSKPIFFELNAEYLDEEIIDLMKQLKMHVFSFGIQSVNEAALKRMNRRFNRQRFQANLEMLKKKTGNSYISFDLIYGLPDDTLDGFRGSIDYALSFKPNNISFFPLLVLPGSEFFSAPDKYGLTLQEGVPHRVLYTDKFSAQDMNAAGKIGLFVRIISKYRVLREYFYFLSRHIYKDKVRTKYLEPYEGFLRFIEEKTKILELKSGFYDLAPSTSSDNEDLEALRSRLKASKFKLIFYLVLFSVGQIWKNLRSS
ncbi:MAG: radical SAM protein [Candidatus Omnitrophica bacterium]|nr:radical SAM protein [Candidatus Omnitrophota bacterium]